jgi:hypothetical protein
MRHKKLLRDDYRFFAFARVFVFFAARECF